MIIVREGLLINEKAAFSFAELAAKSLLYEVSATPKPGLVDRDNTGAHRDMDFYTFIESTTALTEVFYRCTYAGLTLEDRSINLLDYIRPIGLEGERKMFQATAGVNTHKGLIFSLGLICFACGLLTNEMGRPSVQAVVETVRGITADISSNELEGVRDKNNTTNGEIIYRRFGIKGIRGEVEKGFPTVCKYGLPVLLKLTEKQDLNWNDCLVHVLLSIMTAAEDTNVIARHGLNTLDFVRREAMSALKLGGMKTSAGKEKIKKMDEEFINKNISPGGSADLLAVTIMFYLIDRLDKQ